MRIVRSLVAISCSGSSLVMPIAPNACMAWSTISYAISVANALIIEISSAHVAPLVELPGAVVGHQPRGVDLGRGVGDPPLDRLPLGQRLRRRSRAAARSRRSCRARAAPCRSTRPPSAAAACRAASASARSPRLRCPSSFQPSTPAIFERDLVGECAADHRNAAQHVEARRALVDEEGGDAAARALRPCRSPPSRW